MTVTDRQTDDAQAAASSRGAALRDRGADLLDRPWVRPLLAGLGTAAASFLVMVVAAVAGGATAGAAAGSARDAAAVGSALWLLAGGAHLDAGGATFSLVPLLGTVVLVVLARAGAFWALPPVAEDDRDEGYVAGLLATGVARALLAWWGGYLVVTAAAVWLASGGPLRPGGASVLLPAVAVPAVGAALALRGAARDDPALLGPRFRFRLPDLVRRGIRPGLVGAAVLLALGTFVVLVSLLLARDRVAAVHAALDPGAGGSALLVLAQAAVLPDLAIWAVSFLAGPGFQVVDGATISWGGVEGGLLPMVPVLAALPQPGDVPWVVAVLSVAVVVAVGVLIGRRVLRSVARLSGVRTKLAVAAVACATAATVLGLLDLLAGGALGQFRLAEVGAPAVRMTLTLFAELLAGAFLVVVRDAWRLRR